MGGGSAALLDIVTIEHWGCTLRSLRAMQLFGCLAVLEAHIL